MSQSQLSQTQSDSPLLEGQSEAERRALRKSQRELFQTSENLDEIRSRHNELFAQVKFTREAVLDAHNGEILAQEYKKKVDQMVQVPRYDAGRLVSKLQAQVRTANGSFNWKLLGQEVGLCFNAVPSRVSFMSLGPAQIKKRAKRKLPPAAKDEVTQEVNPTKHAVQQSEVQNATQEKTLLVVKKRLKQMTKEAIETTKSPKLDTCSLVLHPTSFVQTVENLFHLSFLVKKGEAAIDMNEDGWQVQIKSQSQDLPPSTQSVLALTLHDYHKLLEKYHPTQSGVPCRGY